MTGDDEKKHIRTLISKSFGFAKQSSIAWQQLDVLRKQLVWGSILSLIMVVSSIVLSVFTARLDQATRQLSTATDELKKYSFDQIRPYNTIQEISMSKNSIKDDFDVSVSVRNSGISPSYESILYGRTFISRYDDRRYYNVGIYYKTDCSTYDPSQLGTIPIGQNEIKSYGIPKFTYSYSSPLGDPKKELEAVNDGHFSQMDLNMLKAEKATLVVIGIVCYKDIEKSIHYTRFCRAFHPDEIRVNKLIYGDLCAEGNDAN